MTLADWIRFAELLCHPATVIRLADDLAAKTEELDRARRSFHIAADANRQLALRLEAQQDGTVADGAADYLRGRDA